MGAMAVLKWWWHAYILCTDAFFVALVSLELVNKKGMPSIPIFTRCSDQFLKDSFGNGVLTVRVFDTQSDSNR